MTLEVVEKKGLRWYPVEGRLLPSVTSVLGHVFMKPDWARYDMNSPEVIFARNRGRAVHTACYWLAMGRRLNPETIDAAVAPYIDQFTDFELKTGFRTDSAEFRVVSMRYGFAGRGDLRGRFPDDDNRHLLDIKTGYVEPWLAGAQTAAYLRADREMGGDMSCARRSVLHLTGEARDKWRLVGLTDSDDYTLFLSALNVFKAAERNGAL